VPLEACPYHECQFDDVVNSNDVEHEYDVDRNPGDLFVLGDTSVHVLMGKVMGLEIVEKQSKQPSGRHT